MPVILQMCSSQRITISTLGSDCSNHAEISTYSSLWTSSPHAIGLTSTTIACGPCRGGQHRASVGVSEDCTISTRGGRVFLPCCRITLRCQRVRPRRSLQKREGVVPLGQSAVKNSGGMELFAPQLMDTMPFRFLSEYHSGPIRAVKESVNPFCFVGFGQPKPVMEVVQAGDLVLHQQAAEVKLEDIGSARIEKIINDMVATMRNAPGVGLAAPQIGVQLQIIVLEDTVELMSYSSSEECEAQQRYPFDLLVIINPKLKTKSGSGSAVFFEGCLSVKGYRALVERDLEVEVSGIGRNGLPIHVKASGWKARILQHECDHLEGNLYVDKMVPRTFRTQDNLRLPLPAGCPKPGVCKHSLKSFIG